MFIRNRLLCLLLQILHLFVDLFQIRFTDPIQSSVNLRKLIKQWTIKLSKRLLDLLKLLLDLERFLSCEPLLSFFFHMILHILERELVLIHVLVMDILQNGEGQPRQQDGHLQTKLTESGSGQSPVCNLTLSQYHRSYRQNGILH
ncbi:hypothetical protein D3C76_1307790 [compost metagenome]